MKDNLKPLFSLLLLLPSVILFAQGQGNGGMVKPTPFSIMVM